MKYRATMFQGGHHFLNLDYIADDHRDVTSENLPDSLEQCCEMRSIKRRCAAILICVFVVIVLRWLLMSLYGGGGDGGGGLDVEDFGPFPDMFKISEWGQGGRGVKVDPALLVEIHRMEFEQGYARHGYNKFLSDRISGSRHLPDVRHDYCRDHQEVTSQLPQASVVIVFKDEAKSVLLRAVYSILNRTPDALLKELILIDFGSTTHELHTPVLRNYLSPFNKAKVHRLESGHSMASAVGEGSRLARGEVLVVLSPRSEVTQGWLEPLLVKVQGQHDTTVLATPLVDDIHYDTFKYKPHPALHIPVFTWDWDLRIHRHFVQIDQNTSDIPSPSLGHMIFAINRTSLHSPLVGFEAGLTNGSSLELSLRCWLCECQVVTVPCSRIGVIARAPGFKPTYADDSSSRLTPEQRVQFARVWLPGWEEFVYERLDSNLSDITLDSLPNETHRRGCKKFDWYIKNVLPDLWPLGESILHRGYLRSVVWNDTVIQLGVNNNSEAYLSDWDKAPPTIWYLTSRGYLRTLNNTCVRSSGNSRSLAMEPCAVGKHWESKHPRLMWRGRAINAYIQLQYMKGDLCLTWEKLKHQQDNGTTLAPLWSTVLSPCDSTLPSQLWIFDPPNNLLRQHQLEAAAQTIQKSPLPEDENELIRKMRINPG